MTNHLQLISIKIIISKYKFLFTLFVYLLIYYFFYYDKSFAFCMNENTIPIIAEAKPSVSSRMTRSLIQREVSAFASFAEIIEEQKSLLKTQQLYINDLETDLKMTEEKNLPLKEDVKRITSKYLDQTFYVDHLKSANQKLYSENVNLRQRIFKLEEELKQLKEPTFGIYKNY